MNAHNPFCMERLEGRQFLSAGVIESAVPQAGLLHSAFNSTGPLGTFSLSFALVAGNEAALQTSYGDAQFDIYNATTGRLTTANPPFASYSSSPGILLGEELYMEGSTDGLLIYNTQTGRWARMYDPVSRGGVSIAGVGSKVFLAGGSNSLRRSPWFTFSSQVNILDTTTGKLSTAQLSVPRASPTAVTVGHTVIFAGGYLHYEAWDTAGSDAVDLYNDVTGQWSTAHLSAASTNPIATIVGDKAIFLSAGNFFYGAPALCHVDMYDARTGQWSFRMFRNARWKGDVVADGKVYFYGQTDKVGVYDPTTDQWSSLFLPLGKSHEEIGDFYGTSAAVAGDKVLFVTQPEHWNGVSRVQIYNTRRNTWSFTQLSDSQQFPFGVSVGRTALIGDLPADYSGPFDLTVDVYVDAPGARRPEIESLL